MFSDLTDKVDSLLTQSSNIQAKVKYLLEQLQAALKADNNVDNVNQPIVATNPAPSPEMRIKQNLYGSLIRQFEDACGRYQLVQTEIKNIMQNKIVRDAEIVLNKRLDPEEKQSIIENPQQIQKIYESVLTGAPHIRLVNALKDMEERSKEIGKLERVSF